MYQLVIAGQKNNSIYIVEIVEKVVVEKVERRDKMDTLTVFDTYINDVKSNCTVSTVETYKNKFNTAMKYLGNIDAEEITVVFAQEFIDKLSKNYSTKTTRAIYDVVNAAFRLAVSKGSVHENPFEACVVNQVVRYEPVILSLEQTDTLLKTTNVNHSLYVPILIAIETGLRRSQVLALTWGDVNFSNSTIEVSKNILSAKKHIFTEGKEHQKRNVIMSDRLSETLLNIKNYRRSIGVAVGTGDYVCLTASHLAMEPTYFNRLFRQLVLKCSEVPDNLRFHDLRWSYINNEVIKGTDPMTIADKVGHKSCVFTMDYYYRNKKAA